MLRSAKFDEEHKHRYYLSRIWDDSHSKILFIGLNPSKADDVEDDNTVRRLITFSQSWGFGGFYIVNLYSFIATEPEDMIRWYYMRTNKMQRALFKQNMEYALRYARICSMTAFCWGAGIPNEEASTRYIRTFRDAYCFGHTKDGHPKHPLFLAGNTELIKFR